MNDRTSKVTSSSILFRFNCSWFSDANGAVRYFAVVVAESDGACAHSHPRARAHSHPLKHGLLLSAKELLQPERRHPLPSYRDYVGNASVRVYQTAYFASRCPHDTDAFAAQVT